MSRALRVLQGEFGRVALLDMNRPLVRHAHHHCHMLFKVGGADTAFDVNGTPSPLTDTSVVLVNAWEPHCYHHLADTPRTEILAFYLEPAWLARIDRIFAASNHRNFFADPCVGLDERTRALVQRLAGEVAFDVLDDPAEIQARIFEVTTAVAHRFSNWRGIAPELAPQRAAFDHRIRRSIAHMREHGRHPLNADRLACVAGLSRPRFFELFKACTGLTPNLYASTLLVEGAISRLSGTENAIAGIAAELGFSEQGNFTRFFSQHVGCTPSDYRRKVDLLAATNQNNQTI